MKFPNFLRSCEGSCDSESAERAVRERNRGAALLEPPATHMTYRSVRLLLVVLGIAAAGLTRYAGAVGEQPPPRSTPAGIETRKFELIEPLIRDEIAQKRLPGAVVLIGVGDRIVYQKAIGNRAVVPSGEAMTLDTIFDLASLTKVVATTTSV